jgi:hypothetical protein
MFRDGSQAVLETRLQALILPVWLASEPTPAIQRHDHQRATRAETVFVGGHGGTRNSGTSHKLQT